MCFDRTWYNLSKNKNLNKPLCPIFLCVILCSIRGGRPNPLNNSTLKTPLRNKTWELHHLHTFLTRLTSLFATALTKLRISWSRKTRLLTQSDMWYPLDKKSKMYICFIYSHQWPFYWTVATQHKDGLVTVKKGVDQWRDFTTVSDESQSAHMYLLTSHMWNWKESYTIMLMR